MKKCLLIFTGLALTFSQIFIIESFTATNNTGYDLNFWAARPSQENKPTLIRVNTTETIPTELHKAQFFWNDSKTSGNYNKTDEHSRPVKITIKEDGKTYIMIDKRKIIETSTEKKANTITDQDLKKIEEAEKNAIEASKKARAEAASKEKSNRAAMEAELKNPRLQDQRNLKNKKTQIKDNINREQESISSCKMLINKGDIGWMKISSYKESISASEKKIKDLEEQLKVIDAKLSAIESELKTAK